MLFNRFADYNQNLTENERNNPENKEKHKERMKERPEIKAKRKEYDRQRYLTKKG